MLKRSKRSSFSEWYESRRQRRAAHRENQADRRGRGSKSGDVLGTAPHELNADNWGGSGGFSTKPSKELGKLD